MEASVLRSLQAPLKSRYREDPEAARIPARAEAVVNMKDITCEVSSGGRTVVAGLHRAAGGDGSHACSADLLLEALVACTGVTLSAVASAMGLDMASARIVAEGTWDARGTLGVDRSVPIGLTDITLTFDIASNAKREALERLIATTERYCVIFQTLRTPPKLSATLKIRDPAAA